ncbi:5-(carboxyamino)imidazole ribonucleotide mutase [candidate division KSB1 bacterium]|nr:MAG: 5-(carboxyamino)imidazole ribonucleotide mutase [candidate division KSB1 bacterium]RPH94934.1 MAG: 5-(carboxyamino)imidazole ribonucleotide mutase [candidate division KSB1 bacterium]
MARVLILIGSSSDREYFDGTERLAEYFGLETKLEILSAHRNAEQLRCRLAEASSDGTEIIVAAAGMAAHLAGVCAAETLLPVIGVPLPGSSLNGMDALLATVQMPAGIPVATVAIGKAGAQNAIVLAARMLALKDPTIREKLREFKAKGARL